MTNSPKEIKVEKVSKKVEKKVENSSSILQKTTKAEQEVLHYITNEFLTIKQIAIRRQTSDKAVYKIVSNLKKKGLINRLNKRVEKSQGTIQPFQPSKKNQIRLHGEEFNIKILYKDHKYKELLEKSNTLDIDGNTIRLYKNSIEVYSGQSFYADTPQKAVYKSIPYWNRLFTRLENDLNIIIIKSRYQNIKLVKLHFAEINNEISKDYEATGDKLRIYAREDGKLAIIIDNSFNLHELETQHPKTAQKDMNRVTKQLQDWRERDPPTNSQIMSLMNQVLEINKETAASLNCITNFLKSQLPEEKKLDKKEVNYFG